MRFTAWLVKPLLQTDEKTTLKPWTSMETIVGEPGIFIGVDYFVFLNINFEDRNLHIIAITLRI